MILRTRIFILVFVALAAERHRENRFSRFVEPDL